MALAIATASLTPVQRRTIVGAPDAARGHGTIDAGATTAVESRGRGRTMLGWLADAGLVLLITLALPLAILVAGTPVALFLRLLVEIARRLAH